MTQIATGGRGPKEHNGPRRPLSIIYQNVSDLKLDPHNPRWHSRKQIGQIARSIEAFGFNIPVLVDADQQLIAGHGRVLAAQLLRLTQVPTITLEHLTDAQRRAFIIADNRLTENAEWNEQLLAEQFQALSVLDLEFSIEATGFEIGEIDLLIEGLTPASHGKEDPTDTIPDSPSQPQVTQAGDVWVLDGHRVYCGDARDDAAYDLVMQGRRAAAVFSDPPYNLRIDGNVTGFGKVHHAEFAMASGEMTAEEFTTFLLTVFKLLARHSQEGALQYVCMDWRHAAELLAAAHATYTEFKNLCVWVKDVAGQGSLYRSQHELVFVFKNGKGRHRNNVQLGHYGRYRTNVWQYRRVNSLSPNTEEGNLSHLHPTIKPVQLVADAILDCTARGDVVLDPFLGSGTTVIAAERTGRVCYGLEVEPRHVDTTVRRWEAFTGQNAVHPSSGQTFVALEKERRNE